MHFLNLHAVAEDLAATYPDITVGWAESYGRDCVRQAVRWFLEKFNVQLYDTMMAFTAAQLMCPSTLRSLAPTAATFQQLRIFPFLNDDSIFNDLVQNYHSTWLQPKTPPSMETTSKTSQQGRSCGGKTMQQLCHIGHLL